MGAGRFCQTKIQKGLLYFTPLCLALGISWVNYIAVRSFACLPSCWLTRVILSLSLYIIFLFLALSVSWSRPYLPALAARWDNDGHLVNRKHRFSLRLYRARQGKGKSCEIFLTYFLFFSIYLFLYSFVWHIILFMFKWLLSI